MPGELDHITLIAMQLCAARLDPKISAAEYVQLVERLVQKAVEEKLEDVEWLRQLVESEEVARRAREMAERHLTTASKVRTDNVLEQHDVGGCASPVITKHPATPAAPQFCAAPSSEDVGVATGAAGSSYEDRRSVRKEIVARIAAKRAEVAAQGGIQLPRGFLEELAKEFSLTKATIAKYGVGIATPESQDLAANARGRRPTFDHAVVRRRIEAERAALAPGRRLRNGFYAQLAEEFKVSPRTIKGIAFDHSLDALPPIESSTVPDSSGPPASQDAPLEISAVDVQRDRLVFREPASVSTSTTASAPPQDVDAEIRKRIAQARQTAATLGQKALPAGTLKRIADEFCVPVSIVNELGIGVSSIAEYARDRKSRQLKAHATAQRMDAGVRNDHPSLAPARRRITPNLRTREVKGGHGGEGRF